MDSAEVTLKWLPFAIPIFFVCMWSFVMFLLSNVGGWRALSEKFTLEREFHGTWKGMQSGSLGIVNYRNCLWVGSTPDGLYLKTGPWKFFSLGHPPLFIPWRAIKNARVRKILWAEYYEFKTDNPSVTIKLTSDALTNVNAYLPQLKS